MLLLIAGVFLLLSFDVNLACVCAERKGVAEELSQASAVFSGRVVAREYRKVEPRSLVEPAVVEVMVVRFEVERWWKGGMADEAILYTSFTKYSDGGGSASSCEYPLRVGEQYLVYAFSPTRGPANELRTSPCSRTVKLEEATEDLKELGEGKEPEKRQSGSSNAAAKSNKSLKATPL